MKFIKYAALIAISLTFIQPNLHARSALAQSNMDYKFLFGVVRELNSMMINFQTDDRKNDHDMIKKSFEDATFEYYGQNYDISFTKYYNLKLELVRVLEKLSTDYLDRTKELLTATAVDNKVIDIFTNYSKHGSYYAYFRKPFDPLNDITPYREDFPVQDFHFFWNKRKVENFLKYANYNYFLAKRVFNDPEIAYFKNKKKILHSELDFIIERYMDVIRLCRHAKLLGLEIYKLKNKHTASYYQDQYNLRKSQFTPIFDDRLPQKFIVDAVDNLKLLYPEEVARKEKIVERVNNSK